MVAKKMKYKKFKSTPMWKFNSVTHTKPQTDNATCILLCMKKLKNCLNRCTLQI